MFETTVTVRVSHELKSRLEALSSATRRSKSFLANEALRHFVESEEQHVQGVQQAMAQARAGLTVPHETVMRELDEIIAAAERARKPA